MQIYKYRCNRLSVNILSAPDLEISYWHGRALSLILPYFAADLLNS